MNGTLYSSARSAVQVMGRACIAAVFISLVACGGGSSGGGSRRGDASASPGSTSMPGGTTPPGDTSTSGGTTTPGDTSTPGGTTTPGNPSTPSAPDTQSPTAQIIFPPAGAATEGSRITVRGTASDAGMITAVRVNGVLATTNDAFNNWQASVALVPGPNTLTVEAVDGAGNSNAAAAQVAVARSGLLPNPRYIDLDVPRNRAIVYDIQTRSLGAIDLSSGRRTLVSSDPAAEDPNGIRLQSVLALVVDSAGNRALVLDVPSTGNGRIVAVDLTSGARTIFSGPNVPAPPNNTSNPFQSPRDMAIDAVRNRLFVVDGSVLLVVDLSNGTRSLPVINGVSLVSATSIAYDAANNRAFVVDFGNPPSLVAIDFNTGLRSTIPNPNGFGFLTPVQIAVDGARNRLLVTDGNGRVFFINLSDGSSGPFVDRGRAPDPIFFPGDIVIDASRNRALVTNRRDNNGSVGEVVGIDLDSRSRTVLEDPTRQNDVPIVTAADIAYDAASSRALVLDNALARIVALDLGQGASRSVVGTLPPRTFPLDISREDGLYGIALDPTFNRALTIGLTQPNTNSGFQNTITGVDFTSGATSVLLGVTQTTLRGIAVDNTARSVFFLSSTSSGTTLFTGSLTDPLVLTPSMVASGAPLTSVNRLVVDPVTKRLFVTASNRVLAVDSSGAATVVATSANSNTVLKGILMDPSSGGLLVVESATPSIQAVSLADGAFSPVILGSGPNPFVVPDGIAIDTKNNFLLIADRLGFVVLVDRVTNERVFF